MKRYLLLLIPLLLLAMYLGRPNHVFRYRQYGGPAVMLVWGHQSKGFSVSLMSNKYYTGVGCHLPGKKKFACDYALSFSGEHELYWQYPKANGGIGIATLIDF